MRCVYGTKILFRYTNTRDNEDDNTRMIILWLNDNTTVVVFPVRGIPRLQDDEDGMMIIQSMCLGHQASFMVYRERATTRMRMIILLLSLNRIILLCLFV